MADGNDFGGEMRLRLADARQLRLRAAVTLDVSGVSTEATTNQDGTNSRVATLKPRGAEVTFEDRGEDFNAVMRAPRQDIYIVEDFTGVSHIFVKGFFTGDPASNRANGEVTGMKIAADNYQRLT